MTDHENMNESTPAPRAGGASRRSWAVRLALPTAAAAVFAGSVLAGGIAGADPTDTAAPTTTSGAATTTTSAPTATTDPSGQPATTTPGVPTTTPGINVPPIEIPGGAWTAPSVTAQPYSSVSATARRGKDGTLRVKKISALDSDDKKLLPGAIFEIRRAAGSGTETIAPYTGVNGSTTASSGTGSGSGGYIVVARFETLERESNIILPEGKYTLVEVKAPKGYAAVEPAEVNVVAERVTSITVADPKAPIVDINKYSEHDGQFLKDAEFKVQRCGGTGTSSSASTSTAAPSSTTVTSSGTTKVVAAGCSDAKDVATFTTKGEVTTLVLDPGSYQIVETKAPKGYVKLTAPVQVSVRGGDHKVVNITNAVDKGTPEGQATAAKPVPRGVIASVPSGPTG